MLMVDRVVLQCIEQSDEIMRFRYENAVGLEHLDDAVDDRMHILNISEAIRRSDPTCWSIITLHIVCNFEPEITLDSRDATLICEVANVGRFDSKDPMSPALEIRQ